MAFLTTYVWHMPIVHVPTFLTESRHPALVKASKACGAMYSGTQTATNFIDRVLATVRDDIIADLVRVPLFLVALACSERVAVQCDELRYDHPTNVGIGDDPNHRHVSQGPRTTSQVERIPRHDRYGMPYRSRI